MKKLFKKILPIFFAVFLLAPQDSHADAKKALFVSVLQEPPVLSSRQQIHDLVDFSKKAGVDTLFVQVYRANQSWFPSTVADDSPYQACLQSVGEDPFSVLIREAHAEGIQVHAWLNLMSLGANKNAPMLKKYDVEILTTNSFPKQTLEQYRIDNQFFLEPGDLRVQRDLLKTVGEVLKRYKDIDGIQFDYIRYPDWHPTYGYTKMNIERYKKAGGKDLEEYGKTQWTDWKRAQVTTLVKRLSKKSRQLHSGIQVSTTGLVPYSRAFYEAMQDWSLWLKSGLVDFVTLMCYSNDNVQYEHYFEDAKKQLGSLKDANIAVGAYSMLDNPALFKEQLEFCQDSGARACCILHYGNLLEKKELGDAVLT